MILDKKEPSLLDTLEILRNVSLTRRRVLIIDDESDYASTDTGITEEVSESGGTLLTTRGDKPNLRQQLGT